VTPAQVRELHRAQPFKPFTIHMADGRRIAVKHPEFMALAPSGRTVIVYQLDESFDIIDLLLVTDLEVRRRPKARRPGT
jgi:hypothetical protein